MEEAFKYSLKVCLLLLLPLPLLPLLLLLQACELGNMAGCVNISMMYAKGEGVDKNPVAAKE